MVIQGILVISFIATAIKYNDIQGKGKCWNDMLKMFCFIKSIKINFKRYLFSLVIKLQRKLWTQRLYLIIKLYFDRFLQERPSCDWGKILLLLQLDVNYKTKLKIPFLVSPRWDRKRWIFILGHESQNVMKIFSHYYRSNSFSHLRCRNGSQT